MPNRAHPIRWGAVAIAFAIRFIPNAGRTVIYTPSGRTYNITGPTVDVPFPDADAVATDRATRLMVVGTSEDRPAGGPDRIGWPPPGMYDTTLSEPIFLVPGSYPASWVDITGSPV